jgi:preprotein translocase subunit SecD
MNFVKENLRLIIILALTLFALLRVLEIHPSAVDSELSQKGKQKLFTVGDFDVFSKLKLGLDLVGGSQFEFQALTTDEVKEITPDVMRGLVKVFENRVNASGTTEAIVQQVGKDRILVEIPGEDPLTVKRRLLKTAHLEFKEYNEQTQTWVPTGITGADLKRAQATTGGTGAWAIAFELRPSAAKAFGDLTARLINRPLGIVLDGKLLSAPTVRTAITAGSGEITGNFTVDEAQDLAVQLNAGALPVPVKILQERSVDAGLGKESIDKSLKTGLFGYLCVVLFMILVYRLSGIVAALALTIYTILALYVFQNAVTLTLAGIAGFILSIGMAVDANILIFERAKEEMRAGKSVFIGLRDGFERAYTSIFDSNMNTSIVCLILIIFGTGIVKGFAITLLIGVALSLFSSLFVSKTLLFSMIKFFNIKETSLFK